MDFLETLVSAVLTLGAGALLVEVLRLRRRQRRLEDRVEHIHVQTVAYQLRREKLAEREMEAKAPALDAEPPEAEPPELQPELRVDPEGPDSRAPAPEAIERPAAPAPAPRAPERRFEPEKRRIIRPPVAPESLAPKSVAPRSVAPKVSLETLVGGRVLLVLGVVVVLFGLAFFLKYAIDNAWIGPAGRILLGVVAGLAAGIGGDRLRDRGWHAFGTALMGAGTGALYLCIYFATARYGMIGQPVGFALAALVTAGAAALALLRGAPLLAYLGFLGGFLAPALLGSGKDVLGPLVAWLLFVQAGVFAVNWLRRWHGLELMAFLASAVYLVNWHDRFMTPGRELAGFGALTALALGIIALCLLRSLVRCERLALTSTITLGMLSFGYVVAGHALLFPEQRTLLGFAVLALAALHFGASVRALDWSTSGRSDSQALSALGIAALAAGLPILLEGRPLPAAWAATGCAAVFVGSRWRRVELAAGGLFMIVAAFVPLFLQPLHAAAYTPFLNIDFWVCAAPCIALVLAGRSLSSVKQWAPGLGALVAGAGAWLLAPLLAEEVHGHFRLGYPRGSYGAVEYAWASATAVVCIYTVVLAALARAREGLARLFFPAGPLALGVLLGVATAIGGHRHPFDPGTNAVFLAGLTVVGALVATGVTAGGAARRLLLRAGLAYGLFLVTAEIVLHGERRLLVELTRREARYAAQIAISVVWTLYAAGLVALGFNRRSADLRWAGLVIFLLTIAKVFLFDMATLPAVYRIASFLVLGVVCIAASFLYQRARPADPETR